MIGVCDWGIGGIETLQMLTATYPQHSFVYFSDSGYPPYGKVNHTKLRKRWLEVKTFLHSKGCNDIIVACNALSTVLEPNESQNVINAGAELIKNCNEERLGITGGVKTVESKVFDSFTDKRLFYSVGQPLSALVEKGCLEGSEVDKVIKEVFDPFIDNNCNTVLLACTHYPALVPSIKRLYPQIELLNPAEALVQMVNISSNYNELKGKLTLYTTGDPVQSQHAAFNAFSCELGVFQKIKI